MSARDDWPEALEQRFWSAVNAPTYEESEANTMALLDAYALELAELIQDPKRWERFGYLPKSMTVYMTAARRAARIIELEVESHGQP